MDQKSAHKYISYFKSGLRITGYLCLYSLPILIGVLVLTFAEVLGIIEEMVVD